jgi:hypothetical protein
LLRNRRPFTPTASAFSSNRVAIEVAVFAAALAAVGRVELAIVFAVLAGINEILNYTLD